MTPHLSRIIVVVLALMAALSPLVGQRLSDLPDTDKDKKPEPVVQEVLVPIDLAAAIDRTVSRVSFKRFEGEEIVNAPPEAVRRVDLARAVRAQKGVPLRAGDVDLDIESLVQGRNWFTQVQVVAEAEGNAPQSPIRVTYICRDPNIASLTIRSLVGGFIGDAQPEDRFTVLTALTRQVGDRYSLDSMDRDLRERLFKGDGRFIDAREERAYRADGVQVTIIVFPAQLVDRMVFTGVVEGDDKELKELVDLDAKSHAGAATIRGIRQAVVGDYLKEGFPYADITTRMVVMPWQRTEEALLDAYPELREDEAETLLDEAKAGESVLVLRIHEGPKVKVGDYEFEGIDRLVDIPGSDVLQPGKLPFNYWPIWYSTPWTDRLDRVKRGLQSKLQYGPTIWTPYPNFILEHALQDASFLQAALRRAGWLDAKVVLAGTRSNEDRSRVVLRYSIDTGPLYVLSMVAMKVTTRPLPNDPKGPNAPQAVAYDELWEDVPYDAQRLSDEDAKAKVGEGWAVWSLTVPVTYAEERWNGDPLDPTKSAITRMFRNKFGKLGYSNLGMELSPQFFEESAAVPGAPDELLSHPAGVRPVVLRIEIDQRQKYRIGEIIIRGNTKTKTSVIRRHLQLYPGDVLDSEEIERAADRLRREQWFDQTDGARGVRVQPSFRLEATDTDSEFLDADILVDVIEGQTGAANFSATFAPGSGFALAVSVTKRNFDITNWSDFTGAGQFVSVELEPPISQRQRYSLTFFEPNMFGYPFSGQLRLSLTEQDFGAWTRGERGGRLQLGYTMWRDFRLNVAYQNFRNQVKDVDDTAAFEIRRDEGITQFAAVSVEGLYSTLNRALFPSGGWRGSLEGLVAGAPFGGNINLWRLTAEGTQAFLISELDETRDISFTLHGISIYQQPWGETNRIPLAQRQFLGSITDRTALRGFESSGVGPSSGDDALGGNFLVNATAQINVEVVAGFFWVVGFLDAGQLVPEIENFDPRGITVSGGYGIRLQLPVFPQPFGIDFGWPIYNQPGNRRQVVAINLSFQF